MDAAAHQLLHARAATEFEQSRFSGRSLRDGDDTVARPDRCTRRPSSRTLSEVEVRRTLDALTTMIGSCG
jgi:hypothetical protein